MIQVTEKANLEVRKCYPSWSEKAVRNLSETKILKCYATIKTVCEGQSSQNVSR